jgi:hypothetical protein
MQSQSRKYRGYDTQKLVAEWFQRNGWPAALSAGAGRPGSDITGMPGVDVEVKATARFEPLAWLKQITARKRPGLYGIGVWRPNGHGPATIANWPVITDLATITALLRQELDNARRPVPDDTDGTERDDAT